MEEKDEMADILVYVLVVYKALRLLSYRSL